MHSSSLDLGVLSLFQHPEVGSIAEAQGTGSGVGGREAGNWRDAGRSRDFGEKSCLGRRGRRGEALV
jgi:hypothetical protein